MATLAITNGQIWDGVSAPFLGTVLCNDHITEIIPGPSPTLPAGISVIDARGGTVIPAFTDSHIHFSASVRTAQAVDLTPAKCAADVVSLLLARSGTASPDEWVYGVKMNPNRWADSTYPTLAQLDQVPNPLIIQHWCCHDYLINTRAIALVGEERFAGVTGVERDPDGKMTGLLVEAEAQAALQSYAENIEEDPQLWVSAFERLLSEGISELHAIGTNTVFMHESLPLFQKLRAAGKLLVRCRFYFTDFPSGQFSLATGFGDDWLSYAGYKIFIDGVLSAKTAAVREPYAGGGTGVLVNSDEALYEAVKKCHQRGLRFMAHCLGDRALDQVLGALERVRAEGIEPMWAPKIAHLEICHRDQIDRLVRLGAIGDIQGGFNTLVAPFIEHVIGRDRTRHFVPVKMLHDAGLLCVGSSDGPIEPTNPLYGIHGAVCRNDVMGREECITLDQALRMYTINAQKLLKNDHRKGLLKPGYIADITVFEDDLFAVPPETLASRKVAATIIDGKVAFRRGA
jgi:predicted amidohydrolase YtcJ